MRLIEIIANGTLVTGYNVNLSTNEIELIVEGLTCLVDSLNRKEQLDNGLSQLDSEKKRRLISTIDEYSTLPKLIEPDNQ